MFFTLRRLIKILLFIGCGCLLIQCTTTVKESHLRISEPLTNPYTLPADAYLALAQKQTGEEKNALFIMAAGRLIYEGQWQRALNILTQLQGLSSEDLNEKQILLAKIDLIRHHPSAALSKLATIQHAQHLSIYYQAQFHETLAQAYQNTKNPVDAIAERIKLEKILPDDVSKTNNQRALWLLLTKLPVAELQTLSIETPHDPIAQGYMQLALIARLEPEDPQTLIHELEIWKNTHPHHPGNALISSSLQNIQMQWYSSPRQIALLLPLTGPLQGPGLAFKEGFMTAYDTSRFSSTTKIRFYDTADGRAAEHYQQALAEGADYIIGPLTKADVSAVAALPHPVPTLLLNEAEINPKDNAFSFGLSPSHEARQVALKARKDGLARAIIIAPEGSWGNEVTHAFTDQWRINGGSIVDTLIYQNDTNLDTKIREILHAVIDEKRQKELKQKHLIDTTVHRREDFDMIFLVAYPSKARQIKPLLNYYYANTVPVYAISSVYAGAPDTTQDRDLNTIIFCDMPWMFTHHIKTAHWPEPLNAYDRLYALGMDSFALGWQLNQLRVFPALGINNNSGEIYLTLDHHIMRMLVFGQFKQGLATPIDNY